MRLRSTDDTFVRSVLDHQAMSLLLFALYACSHYGVSAPILQPRQDQTSWHSEPKYRGTWGLLSSCVITMGICVWSAVHLNVPGQTPQYRWERYIHQLRRTRWTLTGLFAPELVVYCAWIQWSDAMELTRRMNSAKHKHMRKHPWTLSHSFFTGMGGFAIDSSELVPGQDLIYLTTAGALRMSELGYQLPDLHQEAIKDKSKTDSLGKILVCLQAGYMIFQVLGRLIAHLPVTLLEVNTLGHVLCAFTMYAFWFHKPLGVRDPIVLSEEWAKQLMLLWFMKNGSRSSMQDFSSQTNQVQRYRELDLLMLFAYPEHRPQIEYLFLRRYQGLSGARDQPDLKPELLTRTHRIEDRIASTKSRSSAEVSIAQSTLTCADLAIQRDLPDDLEGLSDHRVLFFRQSGSSTVLKDEEILQQLRNSELWNNLTQVYLCDEEDRLERWWKRWCDKIAPEVYVRISRDGTTAYATKKPVPPFRGDEPSVFIPQHIYLDRAGLRRWDLAYRALERDPDATLYVTTHDTENYHIQQKALKTGLVVRHVDNWPSAETGLISNYITPAWIMAAVTALYGGLHALCWRSHFPSVAEMMLWRTASLIIAGGPVTVAALANGSDFVSGVLPPGIISAIWYSMSWTISLICATVYVAARLFILLEAFISLRNLPDEAYQTPHWTTWLPHL